MRPRARWRSRLRTAFSAIPVRFATLLLRDWARLRDDARRFGTSVGGRTVITRIFVGVLFTFQPSAPGRRV
jgi:hypothetical protein